MELGWKPISDPEPSSDTPSRILPITPEARPEIPSRASGPPPLPTPAISRPAPLFTTLSYVLGLPPMLWALSQSRAEAKVPGNDFLMMTVPVYLFIGMAGALVFGMVFALLGHSRGEAKALRALWLVPALASVAAVFGTIFVI